MIVKALSTLLLLAAFYLCWWAFAYAQPIWYLAALVPGSCGAGLFFRRAWASYLWYVIASGVTAVWLLTMVRLALNGLPVVGRLETLISLLPSALLLLVCIGGSVVVRRDSIQR